MIKQPLSRSAIRAIAIRNKIRRNEELKSAQGVLPGIIETPAEKPMHPRLLKMCVESAGFEQDRYAEADAA